MIYNQLNLSNNFNTQNQNPSSNSRRVYIKFNNKKIHEIVGPVPLIDINHTVNNNNNNLPDTLTTNITLNGTIYRHAADNLLENVDADKNSPGFSGIMQAVSGLRQLFSDCPYGLLEIECDSNAPLYSVSGLSVDSINFSQSDNNWAQTTDYTISLSVTDSLYGNDPLSPYNGDPLEKYVTDRVDRWSIEPLDDVTFANLAYNVTQRSEYSNPGLNANNDGLTRVPPVNGNSRAIEYGRSNIDIKSMPQFRVNRTVSAKGLFPKEAANNDKICFNTNNDTDPLKPNNLISRPYLYAKAWVEKIAKSGLQPSNNINGNFIGFLNPNSKIFPCNHTRSTNIDIYNSSYEINDSWLVMTTGVPYVETYSIETSLDQNYIKTVRIAGSINGVSILPDNVVQHEAGIFPTGAGNNGLLNMPISLEYTKNTNNETSNFTIKDLNSNPNNKYPRNTINANRYTSAYSGWIHDIKPLLYRRASLAINPTVSTNNNNLGADRIQNFTPSYLTRPPTAPNNPIYSKEALLSIIPVSTTETYDPRKGTINYSYEFNNKLNIISGVVAENINVTYTNPTSITAEIPVIGRALGPIIQKTGRTNAKKTVNVEISIPPVNGVLQTNLSHPSCPLHTGEFLWITINRIIESMRPYSNDLFIPKNVAANCGESLPTEDTENWEPHQGKYSRTVSWTYVPYRNSVYPCNDFRNH
jgi:hypothetical protein